MAAKDYYPASTEWEVIYEEYIAEDKNYKIKAMPVGRRGKLDPKAVREVRTPYKPRIGQLIRLSKQDT